jgi:transposase
VLLYYHVEGLKLREIARLVETPESPLRRWFQRQSKRRASAPESRVHESTVMRWLEKVYGKVLDRFRQELEEKGGLSADEIEICLEMATEDLSSEDVRRHLNSFSPEG